MQNECDLIPRLTHALAGFCIRSVNLATSAACWVLKLLSAVQTVLENRIFANCQRRTLPSPGSEERLAGTPSRSRARFAYYALVVTAREVQHGLVGRSRSQTRVGHVREAGIGGQHGKPVEVCCQP